MRYSFMCIKASAFCFTQGLHSLYLLPTIITICYEITDEILAQRTGLPSSPAHLRLSLTWTSEPSLTLWDGQPNHCAVHANMTPIRTHGLHQRLAPNSRTATITNPLPFWSHDLPSLTKNGPQLLNGIFVSNNSTWIEIDIYRPEKDACSQHILKLHPSKIFIFF